MALCGHPEGVGGKSAAQARAALAAKLQWADAAGMGARVVTQFCFDASAATGYVDGLRADGFDVDVSLGVVGPSSLALRQRMAERCGVAPPPAADGATPYMRALAAWQTARGGGAGIQAVHLYPFGGLGRTLRWMQSDEMQDTSRFFFVPAP